MRCAQLATGDVQPFVALSKRLMKDGHRVRIATHGKFRSFVREHQIGFHDIGGDPEDLMSYMVKSTLIQDSPRLIVR